MCEKRNLFLTRGKNKRVNENKKKKERKEDMN